MGFIYLLECTDENQTVYKIGFTKGSVKNRIKNLQTGNSYEIKELCVFETKYIKLETTLHNQFSHCRKTGEWFNLNISDVANFLNTCEKIERNFDLLKDNYFFNKL